MSKIEHLFIELLQISLGEKEQLSQMPSHLEWPALYEESERQAIVGVMMDGLERLPAEQRPPQDVLFQWIGRIQMIKSRNKQLNEHCLELQQILATDGFDSCNLKGQGNALLYPNPLRRQSGDVDIWVRGKKAVALIKP